MSTTPPVVIAFGQKDDAIDRLPGDWRDQWRVKVVQATVQAMETMMKKEAMIIFIDSEGRSEATDEEWGMWVQLRRAIMDKFKADTGSACQVQAVGPITCEQFEQMDLLHLRTLSAQASQQAAAQPA